MVTFTGIQPSGIITLGNYLGAIKNWQKPKTGEELYCIVDLHAITSKVTPKDLRHNSKFLAALYIALGLHEKGTIFLQSQVPEHTELAWFLQTRTSLGELERMTQYKDKAGNEERPNAGLLTYPVLMAADILLYDTTDVPVGRDQKQHIELTRNIAEKLNNRYEKELFVIPEPDISEVGAKIYSLTDPTAKMSKSSDNPRSYISIMDEPSVIRKKIKSAVTDTVGEINLDAQNQPGIYNLLQIYATIEGKTLEESYLHFEDKGYTELKEEVAEVVVAELEPLQEKIKEIFENKKIIDDVLEAGREVATRKARKKMRKVKKTFGIYGM